MRYAGISATIRAREEQKESSVRRETMKNSKLIRTGVIILFAAALAGSIGYQNYVKKCRWDVSWMQRTSSIPW